MPVVTDRRAILSYSWVGSDSAGQMLTNKPVFITYSFETSTAALGVGGSLLKESQAYIDSFRALNATAQETARAAFRQWDAASGVTFLEVPAGYGDIKIGSFNFDLGGPYRPSQAAAYGGGGILIVSDRFPTPSTQLFLHEIGHNLGFKHSFEGTYTLDSPLDNYGSTVMSYTSGGYTGDTLGTLDRDAVSYLYGTSDADGRQVLRWSWNAATYTLSQTAFDTGGKLLGVGGNNDIQGELGADQISLEGGGVNVISAGGGNDSIRVDLGIGGGRNTVNGGEGDDTIVLPTNSAFFVDGGAGTDSLQFQAPFSFAAIFSIPDAIAGGSSISNVESVSVTGSNLADRLTAGDIRASLFGFGGDDILTGGAGADSLVGGGGRDQLYGRDGDDQLSVDVADTLSGIVVDGGMGSDAATYRFTTDVPRTLTTTALGAIGVETLSVMLGSGNDQFTADSALAGMTNVYGGGGDDVLRAGASRAQLRGDAGQDQLYAGTGFSFLYGGDDADRFVFETVASSTSTAQDQIEDFQAGLDLIDLTAASLRNVRIQQSGSSSYIVADRDGAQFWLFVRQTASLDDVLANVVAGSPAGDVLVGTDARDLIRGGAGADTLSGGSGRDYFVGTLAELSGDRITDLTVGDRIVASDASFPGFSFSRAGWLVSVGGVSIDIGSANVRLIAAPSLLGGAELAAISRVASRDDMGGDGRSDILWRSDGGQLASWLSNGQGFAGNPTAMDAVSSEWQIAGTGDFNGDGRSDILWRSAGGYVTDWVSTGSRFTGNPGATTLVGNDWHIADTADFNGDGREDILWRSDGGYVTNWFSTGQGFAGNPAATILAANEWHIAGTGDFNGDGRDDILWRSDGGYVTTWLSTGQGFAGNAAATTLVGTDWRIAATGDFDGDGRDDLLWRSDGGYLAEWFSTGQGFAGNPAATILVSKDWHVAATGDYNGDGRDDILWRSDSGYVTDWLSTGQGFAGNSAATAFAGTDWHIV